MTKGKKKIINRRNSATGKFVTKSYVSKNKRTTETERN